MPRTRTALLAAIAGVTLLAGCSSGATPSASAARTVAVVDVQPVAGGDAPNLPDVASRVRQLLSAMGFAGVQVDVTGRTRLTVSIDGKAPMTELEAALEPTPFLFRKVVNTGPGQSHGSVPTGPATAEVTLGAVKAAVGSRAWAAATLMVATTQDGSAISADGPIGRQLAPFGRLTPAQVAVLPAAIQFYVPQISCATLNARDRSATGNPQATVVVCDNRSLKYLLDVAKVSGSDVGSASAAGDASSVTVVFSAAGGRRWAALAGEAFDNAGGHCIVTKPAAQAGHAPVCEIALVRDNKVLAAQAVQAASSSEVQLPGPFGQPPATILAAQLALAGLPVRIAVLSITE